MSPADFGRLADDLEQLIGQEVLKRLPSDSTGELGSMGLNDLLIVYGTWIDRRVEPRARRPHKSAELEASAKAAEHAADLAALVEKIERGDDLTPHLSTAVETAYVPKSQKGRREPDRDRMLAQWGVHHLHLSQQLATTGKAKGFVERTGDLLFAIFHPDDAYLIGIYPHGSWAAKDVFETAVKNWPEPDIVAREISGLRALNEPSDEDRAKLLNAGIMTLMQVGEKLYMPRGQTAAGRPLVVTQASNAVMYTLAAWRENGAEHLKDWTTHIERETGRPVAGGWRADFFEGQAGLVNDDGVFIPIVRIS